MSAIHLSHGFYLFPGLMATLLLLLKIKQTILVKQTKIMTNFIIWIQFVPSQIEFPSRKDVKGK